MNVTCLTHEAVADYPTPLCSPPVKRAFKKTSALPALGRAEVWITLQRLIHRRFHICLLGLLVDLRYGDLFSSLRYSLLRYSLLRYSLLRYRLLRF
jgi:hypothetical protein